MMTKSLFKNRPFLLYLAGNAVSQIGSDFTQFVISLYVLEKTGSATIFASLLSVIIFPRLLLSPISGVLADRLNRKRLLMFFNLTNVIVLFGLGSLYALKGDISLWIFYVLVIYLEIIELFYSPASSAIYPSILQKDQLMQANSMHSLVSTTSAILGPILAGLVYRHETVGLLFFMASGLYVLAFLSKMPLRLPPLQRKTEKISMGLMARDFSEALVYLKSKPILFQMMPVFGLVNLFFSPLLGVCWTFTAREVLRVSPKFFGIGQGIIMSGMLVGSLLGMRFSQRFALSKLLWMVLAITAGLIFCVGADLIVFWEILGLANFSFWLGIFLIFLIALVIINVNIGMSTFFQRVVPLDMMGRLTTLMFMINTGSIPLGNMLFGYLLDRAPLILPYLLAGIAIVVATWLIRRKETELSMYLDAIEQDEKIDVALENMESEDLKNPGSLIQ